MDRAARRHIVLIEDEFDIRESLQDVLEGEGYSVSTAGNGKEALDLMSSHLGADLILLDLMMPVMNGVEFFDHWKKSGYFAEIPLLVMSADTQARQKADEIGAARCLKKPLELEDLLSAIKNVLPAVQATQD